jgi:hypothetical protein
MLCERSEAQSRKLVVEVLALPFSHRCGVTSCAWSGALTADHVGHLSQ